MSLTDACRLVDETVRSRPEYAHTSHLLVLVDGWVVHDVHYGGPVVGDVFSVTKSVLGTLVGVAVRQGLLPDLDEPVEATTRGALGLAGTPSAGQTWRHLLTMTRGSRTDGPWDIDEVMARPSGWAAHVAAAPLLDPPGGRFRYDNGAALLLAAALAAVVGEPLAAYAGRELFTPLGITGWSWFEDPQGVPCGAAHLSLSARHLATLAQLWLDGGRWDGRPLVDPAYSAAMLTAQVEGGPPEHLRYGYLFWIDDDGPVAAGWAGQHVLLVPAARAAVVTTGDPQFRHGPPPTDALRPDWRPALELVRRHVLPQLRGLARQPGVVGPGA